MGFFNNMFTRTGSSNAPQRESGFFGEPEAAPPAPVQIRKPHSFDDIEEIIDRLREKKTVVVYVTEIAKETFTRVLDLLCGAIYALCGGMFQLEKDIYIFTPEGVTPDKNTPY